MSKEEIEAICSGMETLYGDKLPDPEHCPKEFAYLLKLYLYYDWRK